MQPKQLKWSLIIILSLIWGSSFILIFKGLKGLSPLELGSVRILFSAAFLLLIGFKSMTEIRLFQWKYVALTSLFGTFIPAYLFALAETKVSSSICSVLNSLTPLNTFFVGFVAFGFHFKRNQFIGLIIGLIGTAILLLSGKTISGNNEYYYSIFVIIASLCYAININLIKKYLSDVKPLAITTGNFLVLMLPAMVILYFTDFKYHFYSPKTQQALFFVLILGVVGTGIANVIYYKLIQISSPVFASSVTYLIPIVAFFWGILNNEQLNSWQFFGGFIILVGIYLANRK